MRVNYSNSSSGFDPLRAMVGLNVTSEDKKAQIADIERFKSTFNRKEVSSLFFFIVLKNK